MVDFDVLRKQIATRLNGIRGRNGVLLGNLFGDGRPYGRYDGDMFEYFTGTGDVHPILPLSYLSGQQRVSVASGALGIMLEELAAEQAEMSELARTRIAHWRATQEDARLALSVTDETAYSVMRPALDFMLAHYDHDNPRLRSNYRTGALVGQLVAWFLGDTLMDEYPIDEPSLDILMSEETRKEYERFVTNIIRTVFETRQLSLHERMEAFGA